MSTTASVIVRSHLGAGRITRCLNSLMAQKLSPERFEIQVVLNGPDDGTAAVVERFRAQHWRHKIRLLVAERANGPHAANVGLASAQSDYVTFVDDDDWVSPNYLSALLRAAGPAVIAHAGLADIDPHNQSVPNFDNYVNRSVMRWSGEQIAVRHAASALQFNTAKLVRTEIARSVRWDEELKSVGDTLYWHQLAIRNRLELRIVPAEADAVYYRLRRSGSLSRPSELDQRYLADLTRVCDTFDQLDGPDASGVIKLAKAWSKRRRAEVLAPA